MTRIEECICPGHAFQAPNGGIDYGRAWYYIGGAWVCSRCKGRRRADQDEADWPAPQPGTANSDINPNVRKEG